MLLGGLARAQENCEVAGRLMQRPLEMKQSILVIISWAQKQEVDSGGKSPRAGIGVTDREACEVKHFREPSGRRLEWRSVGGTQEQGVAPEGRFP